MVAMISASGDLGSRPPRDESPKGAPKPHTGAVGSLLHLYKYYVCIYIYKYVFELIHIIPHIFIYAMYTYRYIYI